MARALAPAAPRLARGGQALRGPGAGGEPTEPTAPEQGARVGRSPRAAHPSQRARRLIFPARRAVPRRETRGLDQPVAVAQRQVEGAGQHEHHVAARHGLARLEEAERGNRNRTGRNPCGLVGRDENPGLLFLRPAGHRIARGSVDRFAVFVDAGDFSVGARGSSPQLPASRHPRGRRSSGIQGNGPGHADCMLDM